MNPANAVTALRIILSPLFVYFLYRQETGSALLVYLVVWSSDGIDGFIARKFGYHTKLGSYLDPAADKIFLLTTYITLAYYQFIPAWLTWIVIIKDLITALGTFVILPFVGAIEIKPFPEGKGATFFQLTTGFVAIFTKVKNFHGLIRFKTSLEYITGLLTLVAGIHYIIRGINILRRHGVEETG